MWLWWDRQSSVMRLRQMRWSRWAEDAGRFMRSRLSPSHLIITRDVRVWHECGFLKKCQFIFLFFYLFYFFWPSSYFISIFKSWKRNWGWALSDVMTVKSNKTENRNDRTHYTHTRFAMKYFKWLDEITQSGGTGKGSRMSGEFCKTAKNDEQILNELLQRYLYFKIKM